MLENTLIINCNDIIVDIDNTTNFKDFAISDLVSNLSATIQIDVEQNTIRIDGITLSNTQSQVLKQFINQLK
jgi:hypothetical protein